MIAADSPKYSVVVPFFDEEAVAWSVAEELTQALEGLGGSWEAIFVDDGSSDGTARSLESVCARRPQCRMLRLEGNHGQGVALYEGFRQAGGAFLGMMDGDGQNPPEDFARMFPLLDQADLVNGIRSRRHDSWARLAASRVANGVRGRLLGDRLSDAGCAMKVFRRPVLQAFWPFPMLNPYMGAIARSAGYRVIETPVGHRPRVGGMSKYPVRAMSWRPAFEMFRLWRTLRAKRRANLAGRR